MRLPYFNLQKINVSTIARQDCSIVQVRLQNDIEIPNTILATENNLKRRIHDLSSIWRWVRM
jgi:hypothetical protein